MLNREQKKYLRGLSHDKKTIIWIGQAGLTKNVIEEIDGALEHHELIKIKNRAGDKDVRNAMTEELCDELGCDKVQMIGNVITLYRRKRKDPVIKLP